MVAGGWWLVNSIFFIDSEVIMSSIKSYQDLEAWKEAMNLAELVYQITSGFPIEERFSITDQLRRAVVSIPSNIAEGQARAHKKEFLYHLSVARGSLAELETQIVLAHRINYLEIDQNRILIDQITKVGKILNGLIRSLRQSPSSH